jgi:pimeloyl-ACP methyl ester carboxylesterase
MMTGNRVGAFTSDKARARFLARYDSALDRLWPVQRDTVEVGTAFGTARVYRSGPSGGVPVVLLPGAGGGALMWYRYVARFAEARPVFALDPVGEPGGGRQDRPIVDGRDVAQCLGGVLGALNLDHAHLVGCSYGGWTVLQHEIHHPGRATTITLLDPAGFARLSVKAMMWIIAGGLAGLAPAPLRRRAARWLNNPTLRDDEIMRLVMASMSFRRRLPAPSMFGDDDLRAVTAPTLALLGERSQLHDAAHVATRIQGLVPGAAVEVVPGAGHALPIDSPHLADRIAAFLDTADTRI